MPGLYDILSCVNRLIFYLIFPLKHQRKRVHAFRVLRLCLKDIGPAHFQVNWKSSNTKY